MCYTPIWEMLGEEDSNVRVTGISRKTYSRSVSWTDRSCSKPERKLKPNGKPRLGLPPLLVSRRPVEEWPRASSDDLGVWPCNNNPQTPRDEFQFKKDKLAFFDKECSRIVDHIFLGSDAVAKNRELLRQNGITHVLNCVGYVCPEYFKADLVYKTLWLQDNPSEDITSVLYDVFDYFEDVREKGGRVLVHCFQGVSRSASLVIAYLMWREGQSFEDAFQCVKAARGITNPNMGFACQLLQCQKRVHALPPSPSSSLRMYRMAPHSPYDPLHLVAKLLNRPSAQGLDSRGAFVVIVPAAIYIWIGKNCEPVMSNQAKKAVKQVVRYERAQAPVTIVNEGDEPLEFWEVLVNRQLLEIKEEDLFMDNGKVGEKRVLEYDSDLEIFKKALSGGVVPPISVLDSKFETRLPVKGIGWGEAEEKLSKFSSENMIVEYSPCGSPDNFDCYPNDSPDRMKDSCDVSLVDPLSPAMPPVSPTASDYASSFTFSPSSSNWSENLSYLSSCQPSPSGFEAMDLTSGKDATFAENSCSPANAFSFDRVLGPETFFSGRSYLPSIAERRGSNPPQIMLLPSINEAFRGHGRPVRSPSSSLNHETNDTVPLGPKQDDDSDRLDFETYEPS